jgi:hypothetical protein
MKLFFFIGCVVICIAHVYEMIFRKMYKLDERHQPAQ